MIELAKTQSFAGADSTAGGTSTGTQSLDGNSTSGYGHGGSYRGTGGFGGNSTRGEGFGGHSGNDAASSGNATERTFGGSDTDVASASAKRMARRAKLQQKHKL